MSMFHDALRSLQEEMDKHSIGMAYFDPRRREKIYTDAEDNLYVVEHGNVYELKPGDFCGSVKKHPDLKVIGEYKVGD